MYISNGRRPKGPPAPVRLVKDGLPRVTARTDTDEASICGEKRVGDITAALICSNPNPSVSSMVPDAKVAVVEECYRFPFVIKNPCPGAEERSIAVSSVTMVRALIKVIGSGSSNRVKVFFQVALSKMKLGVRRLTRILVWQSNRSSRYAGHNPRIH